jgi:two-component system phosphate regulon sensor histidine kinase PhoR
LSNQLYKDIFLKIVIFANCYLFFGFVFSSILFGVFFFIKYYYLCFATLKTNDWFNEKSNLKAPKFDGYISKLIISIYKKKKFEQEFSKQHLQSFHKFEMLSKSIPDGIALINQDNELIWCNTSAETLLSLTLKLDRNKKINYIIRNEEFIRYIKSTTHDRPYRINLKNKDDIKNLEIQVIPYETDQVLLIISDVTSLVVLEKERKEFLSDISHELNTPLTIIQGYVETIKDFEFKDNFVIKAINHIHNQSIKMSKLINDISLVNKIEYTKKINLELIKPCKLLENVLDEILPVFNKKKWTSEIEYKGNFKANREDIICIFTNLINNSIKYTDINGEIKISLLKTPNGFVFKILDDGIGIANENIDKITNRFYREDQSRSRNTGGVGLGLSIVEKIAKKYNAELEIKSQLGKGSQFIINFPFDN